MEIEVIFNEVISLVNYGYSISKALNKIKIDRGAFYQKITSEQKRILKETVMLHSQKESVSPYYK